MHNNTIMFQCPSSCYSIKLVQPSYTLIRKHNLTEFSSFRPHLTFLWQFLVSGSSCGLGWPSSFWLAPSCCNFTWSRFIHASLSCDPCSSSSVAANTKLICALVVRFVMSDCQRDSRPRLSLWLTMTWVGLCDMSLGLWCAGMELGDGGPRRGEGQVGTCCADGPGAVKAEREAWTEGPRGQVTSRGG
jgi:hypothetical protein